MTKKTYILECENGKRKRITVPADWKVTFGPGAVGGDHAKGVNRLRMPMVLRFYESETKQRAIFTDVLSFRDSEIELEIEETKVQEKEGFFECDGVKKKTVFQAKTTEWKNPDESSKEEFPLLPADEDIFSL